MRVAQNIFWNKTHIQVRMSNRNYRKRLGTNSREVSAWYVEAYGAVAEQNPKFRVCLGNSVRGRNSMGSLSLHAGDGAILREARLGRLRHNKPESYRNARTILRNLHLFSK